MPEVTISIGGREFDVACQEGEEHYLHAAAQLLDTEAQTLIGQIGRMPENRLLLMAGLLLADKSASVDDQLKSMERKIGSLQAQLEEAREASQKVETVEVARVPAELTDSLAELAARAEAMAEAVLEQADAS